MYQRDNKTLRERGIDMTTYMPILCALQSGKLKQEDFVDYVPDRSKTIIMPSIDIFGREEYTTEFDLGWHAVIYKGYGILLVSDQLTESSMEVMEYGIGCDKLKEYTYLYENNQLESISVVPTRKNYEMVPENLRKKGACICSNKNQFELIREYKQRTPYISHYDFNRHMRSSDSIYWLEKVQPLLIIPPDTIVGIEENDEAGKCKEKAFKLYPRGSKEINVSTDFLNEFKNPIWVPLMEAMSIKYIRPTDFIEYISDKENEFSIERVTYCNKFPESEEGWHPQLVPEDDPLHVQIVSKSCKQFCLDVCPDIKSGIVKLDESGEIDPFTLLSTYVRLDQKEIKMVVRLPDNIMVQVNNPEYDGSSLKKAYKLKVKQD